MPPGDVDAINTIVGLLRSGGDVILIFAAYIVWKFNERLSKVETAIEAKKEKTP